MDFNNFRPIGDAMDKILRTSGMTREELDEYDRRIKAEALEYLQKKWADAQLSDFYSGGGVMAVLAAKADEQMCAECTDPAQCPKKGRAVTVIRRGAHPVYPDITRLFIGSFLGGVQCSKANTRENQYRRMLRESGLTEKQLSCTFENYEIKNLGGDVTAAKARAMFAAKEGSWFVIAGIRGTGKTHLAIAIMQVAMKQGRRAYFRLVSEMLESLREGYSDGTHDMQMNGLKNVPCLVLDDLGKERSTEAGYDFLYHILDYRYRNELQTIITTNAMSREILASWDNPDYLMPLLSRVDEMGGWVCIARGNDYRLKIADEKKNKMRKNSEEGNKNVG